MKTSNFVLFLNKRQNEMKEINIYGDLVPFKYWDDDSAIDLKDLRNALSDIEISEGETLTVNIHTFGGCTTTAFGMYNLLKRFKADNKITIKTRVDGYCASSGVILLLAGDERVGNKYLNPFVHNAWTWEFGGINKEDAKKIYEDLDKVDNAIAELYAQETSITKEEALQFMSESRDLTTEECQKYGFYTELENVPVVENSIMNSVIKRNTENRRKNTEINMSKNKQSAWNALKKQVDNFFNGKTLNKIVFTADNTELDFYELNEDDAVKVGDKARFDNKPAGESNDGKYVMPTGETYVFEGEELKEIQPKEDNEDAKNEIENLKKEIENLKADYEALKKENETVNKKLKDATTIIENFKNIGNLGDDDNDDEPARDPKPASDDKESRVVSALNKLKKQK